jgi:hypothetical protein
VDLKLNLWKKVADVVLKVIETAEIDASHLPWLAVISPAFLLKIKGSLDIEIDDDMK